MDFRFFQKLFEHATFDEIKVIGKDILIEEHSGHIIGMTRKDKQVRLYILEQCESVEDIESCAECEDEAHEIPQAEKHQTGVQKVSFRGSHMECTRREQMKHSMESERNRGFFLHIRSFQVGDRVLETAGATCGNMQNGDYSEAFINYVKRMEFRE